jgi:enterochelin esterase family protein
MKFCLHVLSMSLLIASTVLAQRGPSTGPATGPTAGRRGGGGPGIVSPEVHADGTVTFRLQAPKASEVTLTGDWLPAAEKLTKDEQGIWSVKLGPLEPGLGIYSFTTDGVAMADPVNPRIKLRARGSASLVDVPGTGNELWVSREVPHGTVEINYHKSKVLNGADREFRVYTPPGYDQNPNQRYPVMYLLHGNNDTQAGWVDVGRANMIMDNLIADKKAVPMIVVMPFGHAPLGATGQFNMERYLLDDVMPTVEKSYRIAAGRENCAVVGYSMGAGHSLSIGLGNLDRFSAVAAFSGAIGNLEQRYKAVVDDPEGTNAKLKLLWLGCGRQDSAFAGVERLSQSLTTHKIRHTFLPTEGRHNYTVWRKYLIEVAPLLFQTK